MDLHGRRQPDGRELDIHTMNFQEALDIVVARTGHQRYRQLCDPDDPAFDPAYPPWIISQAEQPAGPRHDVGEMPGFVTQLGNFVVAVGQHIADGWKSADDATAAARLATCRACDLLDADSCRLCGCHMPLKVTWLEQVCPAGKW
jgi:hypothetical protein